MKPITSSLWSSRSFYDFARSSGVDARLVFLPFMSDSAAPLTHQFFDSCMGKPDLGYCMAAATALTLLCDSSGEYADDREKIPPFMENPAIVIDWEDNHPQFHFTIPAPCLCAFACAPEGWIGEWRETIAKSSSFRIVFAVRSFAEKHGLPKPRNMEDALALVNSSHAKISEGFVCSSSFMRDFAAINRLLSEIMGKALSGAYMACEISIALRRDGLVTMKAALAETSETFAWSARAEGLQNYDAEKFRLLFSS